MSNLSERSYRDFDLSKILLTFISNCPINTQYFLYKFSKSYLRTYGQSVELNIEDNSDNFYKTEIAKLDEFDKNTDWEKPFPESIREMLFFKFEGTLFLESSDTDKMKKNISRKNTMKTLQIELRESEKLLLELDIKKKKDDLYKLNLLNEKEKDSAKKQKKGSEPDVIYSDLIKDMIFCSDPSLGDAEEILNNSERMEFDFPRMVKGFNNDITFEKLHEFCGTKINNLSRFIEKRYSATDTFELSFFDLFLEKKNNNYYNFYSFISKFVENAHKEISAKNLFSGFFTRHVLYYFFKYVFVLDEPHQNDIFIKCVNIAKESKSQIYAEHPEFKTGEFCHLIKNIVDLKFHPNPDDN